MNPANKTGKNPTKGGTDFHNSRPMAETNPTAPIATDTHSLRPEKPITACHSLSTAIAAIPQTMEKMVPPYQALPSASKAKAIAEKTRLLSSDDFAVPLPVELGDATGAINAIRRSPLTIHQTVDPARDTHRWLPIKHPGQNQAKGPD